MISCERKPEVSLDVADSALIPLPKEVTGLPLSFVLDKETSLYIGKEDAVSFIGNELQQALVEDIGTRLPMIQKTDTTRKNAIHLVLSKETKSKSPESYTLSSNQDKVVIMAGQPEGLYRGVQTLLQLVPMQWLESDHWQGELMAIPGVKIRDEPYYTYRGAMLDVARHFFKVKDVKRYIDLLALYKINTLHLHLSDDQGWRIEIKSWPKLTEIGGSTAVGGGKGGFYTQEDYKEIVAYAAQKYITIIPEIDMPGHTNAALASYPELNCNGKATKLYTGMRVGFSSLCVDKEITYMFIDDVIRELAAITPGEYIHLGGDESHVTSKKEYNLFLQTVFPIVKKYNKKVMGWEDIYSAGVDSSMILQHWTNRDTALKGLKKGARVVLSPAPYTYLDMKYNDSTQLGLTWAGTISIEKAYNWSPQEFFSPDFKEQVVGVESPLWTETVTTIQDIEYMAFPRIIGHAELGWSGQTRLDKNSYYTVLVKNLMRLDRKKVNYKK
jgi:hexosaminidase